MKIRYLLTALFAMILVCVLVPAVQALETSNVDPLVPDGLEYSVADGGVTITRYTGSATDLIIPDTIEGYPVTQIGVGAFSNCENLHDITIPAGIYYVGPPAFANCYGIVNV